jgi:hypothetical protein
MCIYLLIEINTLKDEQQKLYLSSIKLNSL